MIPFLIALLGGLTTYGIFELLTLPNTDDIEIIEETYEYKFAKSIGLIGWVLEDIKYNNVGCEFLVDMSICSITSKDLEERKEKIEKRCKCKMFYENIPKSKYIKVQLVTKDVKELPFEFIALPGTRLLIGYDFKGLPIVADMLVTPHILVTGLSGNGKTGCIRIMIKNLQLNNNADIVLLNGFNDDYEGFNLKSINNHNSIKDYIKDLLEGIEQGIKRIKPLYVIFEELGKVKDKELIDLTTKLLQYGRHNKIYLVGVIQTATKEELKFKSLFNARLTFKQLEESSYRVVLGCSINEKLRKREFYLFTDELYRGKTYKLDF